MLQIQRGISNARLDDTKSLKGAILDWITPHDQPLRPPLFRHIKMDRGFRHERTGSLLCPVELDWSDPEYALSLQYSAMDVNQSIIELRSSYAVACWLSLVTNGLSSYMQVINMKSIPRITGKACFAVCSWSRSVEVECFRYTIIITFLLGFQACIYISQLR